MIFKELIERKDYSWWDTWKVWREDCKDDKLYADHIGLERIE